MKSPKDIIDFDPAVVGSIEERDSCVAVIFPDQPMFSDCQDTVTNYRCELRIWGGRIDGPAVKLPLQLEKLNVKNIKGEHCMFLPLRFRMIGPVTVTLQFPEHEQISIHGQSVSLRLFRKKG